ncbi:MAG: SEC-C domain-containing protein [Gammaproteobacteria bacterium]|nr:SEC-C domain-containing protein [Gammaproteobacteria bacterium]
MKKSLCLCGSNKLFEQCCDPFLKGEKHCETAEQLMRSRYCAFALNQPDYLLFTSSTSLKSSLTKSDLQQTIGVFDFLKLDVTSAEQNSVAFCALMLAGNELHTLKEVSTFVKQDDLWKYESGVLEEQPIIKLSRNDMCPCGSGKKFKKCHQA